MSPHVLEHFESHILNVFLISDETEKNVELQILQFLVRAIIAYRKGGSNIKNFQQVKQNFLFVAVN